VKLVTSVMQKKVTKYLEFVILSVFLRVSRISQIKKLWVNLFREIWRRN